MFVQIFLLFICLLIFDVIAVSQFVELIVDKYTSGTEHERTIFPIGTSECEKVTKFYWNPIFSNETDYLDFAWQNRRYVIQKSLKNEFLSKKYKNQIAQKI